MGDMTTLTITDADVGIPIARQGVLTKLVHVVAGRVPYQKLILVDADYTPVNKQLWCSDMLNQATAWQGAVPANMIGTCFQNASIAFGTLFVEAVPDGGQYDVDCSGSLTAAEIEVERRLRDERRYMPPPTPRPDPPTSIELCRAAGIEPVAPPEPKPPPRWMLEARETARFKFDQEVAARRAAKGPVVVGAPLQAFVDDELTRESYRWRGHEEQG
jgi:hypothetical protein